MAKDDSYVLVDGYRGPFIISILEPSRMPLPQYEGKHGKDMLAQRMVLVLDPLAGLSEDDVVNPELPEAEPARVEIYCAIEEFVDGNGQKSARGWNGRAKDQNRVTIAQHKGRDFIRHSEFLAIIKACGADISVTGECKPVAGLPKLRPIVMRVGQLDGIGSYPPRNVFRAWWPDKESADRADSEQSRAMVASALAAESAATSTAISALSATASPATMTLKREADKSESGQPKMGLKRSSKADTGATT